MGRVDEVCGMMFLTVVLNRVQPQSHYLIIPRNPPTPTLRCVQKGQEGTYGICTPFGVPPPTDGPQESGGSAGCPGGDGVPMGYRWGADEAFPRDGAGPYSGVPSMC